MDCFVTKISKTQALLATLGAAGAMALATTASADTRVTVQSGDTVAKLADQYHSSVEAIKEKNQLADPNIILVGQQLDIPNDDQNGNNGDNETGDSNSQVKTVDSNVQVATNSTNEATGQSRQLGSQCIKIITVLIIRPCGMLLIMAQDHRVLKAMWPTQLYQVKQVIKLVMVLLIHQLRQ